MKRARIGDTVTARSLGWVPPDFTSRDLRLRGVLVDRHCSRMAMLEFWRGGVLCRGFIRAQTIRVVARAKWAGAVDGVSWVPIAY